MVNAGVMPTGRLLRLPQVVTECWLLLKRLQLQLLLRQPHLPRLQLLLQPLLQHQHLHLLPPPLLLLPQKLRMLRMHSLTSTRRF